MSPYNASRTPGTSVDNSSPGNNGGMNMNNYRIEGGRLIGRDAPGGGILSGGGIWNRKSAGLADFFTLNKWDFDKRGTLFGGKSTVDPNFGTVAPNYEERIGGQVVPKDGTELENPTGPEGGPRVDAKEKKEKEEADELDNWNQKVDRLEGIAQRGQRRQMIAGGLTGMGQSIMEGTLRGADSLDRAQAATAQMISNMPTLQLTAMKYAQQQNYGLG